MDAFAVSVTDGLIYTDINKRKSFFIAGTFGFMQGLMPLIGYWVVELVSFIVGSSAGETAGLILANIVTWIAFILLLFIGGKMLVDAFKDLDKPAEKKESKKFSYKEVLIMGVATAIDAMAVGVSLWCKDNAGNPISNNITIWPHVVIIMICTFIISLIGLFLGTKINKLLKGKFEICSIIGGSILIALALYIVLGHYFEPKEYLLPYFAILFNLGALVIFVRNIIKYGKRRNTSKN